MCTRTINTNSKQTKKKQRTEWKHIVDWINWPVVLCFLCCIVHFNSFTVLNFWECRNDACHKHINPFFLCFRVFTYCFIFWMIRNNHSEFYWIVNILIPPAIAFLIAEWNLLKKTIELNFFFIEYTFFPLKREKNHFSSKRKQQIEHQRTNHCAQGEPIQDRGYCFDKTKIK